jgi:hypothetical protein
MHSSTYCSALGADRHFMPMETDAHKSSPSAYRDEEPEAPLSHDNLAPSDRSRVDIGFTRILVSLARPSLKIPVIEFRVAFAPAVASRLSIPVVVMTSVRIQVHAYVSNRYLPTFSKTKEKIR